MNGVLDCDALGTAGAYGEGATQGWQGSTLRSNTTITQANATKERRADKKGLTHHPLAPKLIRRQIILAALPAHVAL